MLFFLLTNIQYSSSNISPSAIRKQTCLWSSLALDVKLSFATEESELIPVVYLGDFQPGRCENF